MTTETIPPIGLIGGTGLYAITDCLENVRTVEIETPYGKPSGPLTLGDLKGCNPKRPVVFLPRHGPGHKFSPTEVPYAANIWAMKSLGVRIIISFSAVGSLQEQHKPTDIVMPLQFIDRTKARDPATFFRGIGVVAHISFADPICPELAQVVYGAAQQLDPPVNATLGGTYVCIEGPAFSTRAESNIYRSWGADVIGMTNLTEAKYAREAEIAYCTVALVTDYDCWKVDEEPVTSDAVLAVMKRNSANAVRIIERAVRVVDPCADWPAHHALETAVTLDKVSEEAKEKLGPIVARFIKN